MSGPFARVSPPVGRAQGGTVGANQVCLRAFRVLALRVRPCGGFACFASCRSPLLPRVPALTHFACPHATVWALLCSRGGGRVGLLVGVFARWVVWCLRLGCVRLGCLRACLCALAWGWWGQCGPAAPPFALLACLRVHALVWAALACAGLGGNVGAGHGCPAPCCVVLSTTLCARGERREGWGCSRGGEHNPPRLRSPTCERVTPFLVLNREGGASGRTVVVWLGAGARGFGCVQFPGGVRGIGWCAGLAPVRVLVGIGGVVAFLVVTLRPSFGCVAWCWGGGVFSLVVGLGWGGGVFPW